MKSADDAKQHYSRMFEHLVAFSVIVALAVGLFAPEILSILSPKTYQSASQYILVLAAFSGPIALSACLFNLGAFATGKTYLFGVSTAIAAITNIALNLLLDPWLGVWGAVWSTILAGIVYLLVSFAAGKSTGFLDYRLRGVAIVIAIYAVLMILFLMMPNIHVSLILRIFALIVMVVTTFLTNTLPIKQVTAIIDSRLLSTVRVTSAN